MEEVGLRMHKYSDRWVSCRGGTEEPVKDESSRPIRADVLRAVLATALMLIQTLVSRIPIRLR